jgi:hypothetical protein
MSAIICYTGTPSALFITDTPKSVFSISVSAGVMDLVIVMRVAGL